MKTAVAVVDMINDFVTGVFKNQRAVKIIPNAKRLLVSHEEFSIPLPV